MSPGDRNVGLRLGERQSNRILDPEIPAGGDQPLEFSDESLGDERMAWALRQLATRNPLMRETYRAW